MGVDEEFERVRRALRTEEQALAQEFERIDAEARAAVDASVEHVRAELATQADRIREAIAQQRDEIEARTEELRHDVESSGDGAVSDEGTAVHEVTDAPEATAPNEAPEAAETTEAVEAVEAASVPGTAEDPGADADAHAAEEPADSPPAGTAQVTQVVDDEYPDDIVWADEVDDSAAERPSQVEQSDGTEVSHVTAGGEGSDDRIGRVERGD